MKLLGSANWIFP